MCGRADSFAGTGLVQSCRWTVQPYERVFSIRVYAQSRGSEPRELVGGAKRDPEV